MATKLKKMKLTSVDLVRAGANQEADICLFKSADPAEAPESPTENEKNIFKRFLNWMRENPQEAQNEPQNPIEKSEETQDLEFLYKSALAESLHSIMADETLTEIEKKDMTEESLRQYAEKIKDLERQEEVEDEIEDRIEDDHEEDEDDRYDELEEFDLHKRKRSPSALWDVEDPEDEYDTSAFDEIDEVEKYNHNHGADGRFTDAAGASGGGSGPFDMVGFLSQGMKIDADGNAVPDGSHQRAASGKTKKPGGGSKGKVLPVNDLGTMTPDELERKETRRDELWDKEDHGKITRKEKEELKDLERSISEHYSEKKRLMENANSGGSDGVYTDHTINQQPHSGPVPSITLDASPVGTRVKGANGKTYEKKSRSWWKEVGGPANRNYSSSALVGPATGIGGVTFIDD